MQKSDRQYWGKQFSHLPPLDLTRVQLDSWKWFQSEGIKDCIAEVTPIEDFTGKSWKLEFLEHYIEKPTLTPLNASRKGLSFAAPLRVKTRLTNKITGKATTGEVFWAMFLR